MDKIEQGTYVSNNGTLSYVWELGEFQGNQIWRGTQKDVGFAAWDLNGKELSGESGYDLHHRVEDTDQ